MPKIIIGYNFRHISMNSIYQSKPVCGKYSWRTEVTAVLHQAFEVMIIKSQTNMLKIIFEKACRHHRSD